MDSIKQLLDSGAGTELKEYLLNKLNELDSIENISEKDTPTHQTIEVKAQKRAHIILKEILSEIITLSEPIKVKDKRDSFAIE